MKKILFFLLLFCGVSSAQWNKLVLDYGTISGSTITLTGTSFHSFLTNGQQIYAHIYNVPVSDSEEIAQVTYNSSPNTFTVNSVIKNYYGGTSAVTFPDTNVVVRYEYPLYLTDGGTGTTSGGSTSFANPSAILGLSAINGSAATAMRSDAAPALDQTIIPTWTGLHTYSQSVGSSQSDALLLQTTTAATSGNQKFSPAINLQGNWWNTTISNSQAINWRIDNEPTQGATGIGGGSLVFSSSVNGGSYTERFAISNFSGALRLNGATPGAGFAVFGTSGILSTFALASGSIPFGTSFVAINANGTDFTWNQATKTLGIGNAGISTGKIAFGGSTSGTATIQAQNAAGGSSYTIRDQTANANFVLSNSSGSAASCGQATLSAGTVTVNTSFVQSNSVIILTDATTGTLTNIGTPTVGVIVGGVSFVINSSNILDTSNVNWFIINK